MEISTAAFGWLGLAAENNIASAEFPDMAVSGADSTIVSIGCALDVAVVQSMR